MSVALIAACFWVLAATMVALLPRHRQRGPGIALLLAAVPLIGMVALSDGPVLALFCLAGALSVFRAPLAGLVRRTQRVRA